MAMNKEYFWAEQLSAKKKTVTWNPTLAEDEDDSFDESSVQHFLFLKQAVLGPEVTEKERCVIEVTSEDIDGDTIKQPLFSLRLGLNESATLDVGFQPPVTFHLMKGDGPVYLSGQHALELQDDKLDDFEDEEDEDEEENETVEEEKLTGILDQMKTKKRKRPFDTPSEKNKKKQPKLDQSVSSGKTSEDEDDDDDEDDEDFDPKAVKKGSKASKEDEDDEDDDDDDEDDDDFEDMEDDDDEDDSEEDEEDDDDEEDEEEEEEETAKVNVKKSKNQKQQKKNTKMNGKATKVEAKIAGGGDAKAKESQKKKGGKPQTIQEIKDDITKSPGKPKKEGKFFNFIKNTYRITDQQKLQELWNWHKNTNL